MSMTALQRKAALRAAATMKRMTMTATAEQLGVSYNHLSLVLAGEREASKELKQRIAAFMNEPINRVFPEQKGTHRPAKPKTPPSTPPSV